MSLDTVLPAGSAFLDYRIEKVLGRGGMGVVYLAEDVRLRRRVALKLLPPQLVGDAGFGERLLLESRLAAAIDHPNIVPIYESGDFEGRIFISMRYVAGNKFTKEYKPSEPDCWTRFSAVPVFVNVTSAPLIAAPDESCTTPAMEP